MKYLSLLSLLIGIVLILTYMKIPTKIAMVATAFIIAGIHGLFDELKKG